MAQPLSQLNLGQLDLDLPASTSIRLAQNDSGTGSTQARDWPAEIDIDPPVIDHEALETGVPGQEQRFSAVVIDDRGLKHVTLYHRDRSGAQYESIVMQSLSDDEFAVTIDTSVGQKRIEYYIEALDTGGNRVLKGFPFFPLVRQLTPAPGSQTQANGSTSGSASDESKLIYVLLGVAAVGVALALSGRSGGSTTPQPGTVPLTIRVTPP